jgi:hypothetical protein
VAGTVVAVIEPVVEELPVAVVLVPVIANVYAVEDWSPVTVKGEPAPEAVKEPGEDVAV